MQTQDPGDLRLDNSTQNLATGIYICDTDENGNDISSYLQTIDDSTSTIKGHVKISNKTDPVSLYYSQFQV